MPPLLIVVALAFDFLNGLHDAANSIATIVSTRVLAPRWAVAWAVPLWHGVDLCRDLSLGQASLGIAVVHVLYLLAWVVGGYVLALRCFRRRLEK